MKKVFYANKDKNYKVYLYLTLGMEIFGLNSRQRRKFLDFKQYSFYNLSVFDTCVDPESFVREVPTLTTFILLLNLFSLFFSK